MGLGFLRTLYADGSKRADLVPVDAVINAVCAAAAKVAADGPRNNNEDTIISLSEWENGIEIVNCTSDDANPLLWSRVEEQGLEWILHYALEDSVWYPGGTFKSSRFENEAARLVFQWIPALLVDLLMLLMLRRPWMWKVTRKVDRATEALEFFTTNEWRWERKNAKNLASLTSAEKAFTLDTSKIDWSEYFASYVLGARTYVMKQDPKGLAAARDRLWKLKVLHNACMSALVSVPMALAFSYFCF